MDWFLAVPKELQDEAVRFNHEHAWAARNAYDVLENLRALSIPVLGTEVWLPAAKGPLITGYQFSVNPKVGESRDQFTSRSIDEVRDFVWRFRWSQADRKVMGREPLFNFTVDD